MVDRLLKGNILTIDLKFHQSLNDNVVMRTIQLLRRTNNTDFFNP